MDANVGDLVVCVKRGAWEKRGAREKAHGDSENWSFPTFGQTCRVSRTAVHFGQLWYGLDGFHDKSGYLAKNFRPINDEPDNVELIALIKRPVSRPVSA